MVLNQKNIKKYISLNWVMIGSLLTVIMISIFTGLMTFSVLRKQVVINENGQIKVVSTMKGTVKDVLRQNDIKVSINDYINSDLDQDLQKINNNQIYIKSAIPFNVVLNGEEHILMSYKDNVRDALTESDIGFQDGDKLIGTSLESKIIRNMKFGLAKVRQSVVSVEKIVPFGMIRRESMNLSRGEERTVRDGREGSVQKTYSLLLEDGKEVERKLLSETVVNAPVDKVVEFGTMLIRNSARGEKFAYSKTLNMRATAYTASYADTGKGPGHPEFGITRTGIRAKRGVIAVDPRVIPLGTRVYIEMPGNIPDYGYAIAADTGGAIKGDLIDLYFNTSKEVNDWGCRRVKVYILDN